MGGLRFDFCTVVDELLIGKGYLPCHDLGGFEELLICSLPNVLSQNIGVVLPQPRQLNSRREISSLFAPVIGQKKVRYRPAAISKLKP